MKESHFSEKEIKKMIDKLRISSKKGAYMESVLLSIAKNIHHIPIEEDRDRYVIEHIYPH